MLSYINMQNGKKSRFYMLEYATFLLLKQNAICCMRMFYSIAK